MVDNSSGNSSNDLVSVGDSGDGDGFHGLNSLDDLIIQSLIEEDFVVELFSDLTGAPLLLLTLLGVSGLGDGFLGFLSSCWCFSLALVSIHFPVKGAYHIFSRLKLYKILPLDVLIILDLLTTKF